MKLKRSLIVYAWLAGAAVATSCSGGGRDPALPPFDPFGTDPAPITGSEPTDRDNEAPSGSATSSSLEQLCDRACTHIEATCGDSGSRGTSCASECAASTPMGCEAQFKAFLACIGTQPLTCTADGSIDSPACEAATIAISSCASGAP